MQAHAAKHDNLTYVQKNTIIWKNMKTNEKMY